MGSPDDVKRDIIVPFEKEHPNIHVEVDLSTWDLYWDKLTSGGGKEIQCGWLQDKYGISWQIVPKGMFDLVSANPKEVMAAVMKMVKLDMATLKAAAKKK